VCWVKKEKTKRKNTKNAWFFALFFLLFHSCFVSVASLFRASFLYITNKEGNRNKPRTQHSSPKDLTDSGLAPGFLDGGCD